MRRLPKSDVAPRSSAASAPLRFCVRPERTGGREVIHRRGARKSGFVHDVLARSGAANVSDDLAAMPNGTECRKTEEFVDEIPAAYKSIDAVMTAQSDLVQILHTLKPALCVKGAENSGF